MAIFTLTLATGCNVKGPRAPIKEKKDNSVPSEDSKDKPNEKVSERTPVDPALANTIGWTVVNEKVITPFCIKCHNAEKKDDDIDLSTFELNVKHAKQNEDSIRHGRMPTKKYRPQITDEAKNIFYAWVQLGTPKEPKPAPAGGTPAPGVPTAPPTPPTAPPAPPTAPAPTGPITPDPTKPTLPTNPTPPGPLPPIKEPPISQPDKVNPQPAPRELLEKVSWKMVNEQVIIPYCIKCHTASKTDGDVNLDTFELNLKHARENEESIRKGTMPTKKYRPQITEEAKNIFYAWIEAGTPKEPKVPSPGAPVPQPVPQPAPPLDPKPSPMPVPPPAPRPAPAPAPEPTPTPEPSPAPTEPPKSPIEPTTPQLESDPRQTYQWIHENIIVPKCLDCHRAGGDEPLMETYAQLIDPANKSVIIGKPEESLFYTTVIPGGKPFMPPPNKTKYRPINAEEVQVLKNWILNGAKEH